MIHMILATGSGRDRNLKYKTLLGARKAAAKDLGTDHPRMDPDGYAVGVKGDCLFFREGCSAESIFPKLCKHPKTTIKQHHYIRREGSQEIIAEAEIVVCLTCYHSMGTVYTTGDKEKPFEAALGVHFEDAARKALDA
jgi:hypothetical protein